MCIICQESTLKGTLVKNPKTESYLKLLNPCNIYLKGTLVKNPKTESYLKLLNPCNIDEKGPTCRMEHMLISMDT